MHNKLLCSSVRNQVAFIIGDETDMTDYDDMGEETNEFDQVDESEQQDEVFDLQEDKSPEAFEIDDANHDDLLDHDKSLD